MSTTMDPSDLKLTAKQISVFSDEYKQRRRQQMMRFFGATVVTLISSRLAFRGVKTRKYIPNMFQANHKQQAYSYQGEAVSALAYGTGLATGSFAMLVLGTCWISDISTFPEFSMKIKQLMGDQDKKYSVTNMDMDEDTKKVADALESLLGSEKKD